MSATFDLGGVIAATTLPIRRDDAAPAGLAVDDDRPAAHCAWLIDTKIDRTPDLIAELAQLDSVVAVQEFRLDARRAREIRGRCDIAVIAGADDLLFEALLAGASGWFAGCPNALPRGGAGHEMRSADRVAEARALFAAMTPVSSWDSRTEFVQAIEHSTDVAGESVDGPIRPQRAPSRSSSRPSCAATRSGRSGRAPACATSRPDGSGCSTRPITSRRAARSDQHAPISTTRPARSDQHSPTSTLRSAQPDHHSPTSRARALGPRPARHRRMRIRWSTSAGPGAPR